MQRETLVARAIVAYEIRLAREGRASTPLPRLTTDGIVAKYGLDWGIYPESGRWIWKRIDGSTEGERFSGAERAHQNVRNELNRAFRKGELCKLRDSATGKKAREGKCIVFTLVNSRPSSLAYEGVELVWGV